jgi:hypothetical protein
VEDHDLEHRVAYLDVCYCDGAIDTFRVPAFILRIETISFAGAKLRNPLFDPGSRLRVLDGFQGCSMTQRSVPDSVESIGAEALAACRYLRLVEFSPQSRLHEMGGFQGTAIRTMSFPASLEVIGAGAFSRCDEMKLMHFAEESRIRSIFLAVITIVILPDSLHAPPALVFEKASGRIFIEYTHIYLRHQRRWSPLRILSPSVPLRRPQS